MLIPVIAYFVVMCYGPMYGVVLAFKDYRVHRGIMPMGGPADGFVRSFYSRPIAWWSSPTVVLACETCSVHFAGIIVNEVRNANTEICTERHVCAALPVYRGAGGPDPQLYQHRLWRGEYFIRAGGTTGCRADLFRRLYSACGKTRVEHHLHCHARALIWSSTNRAMIDGPTLEAYLAHQPARHHAHHRHAAYFEQRLHRASGLKKYSYAKRLNLSVLM